MVLVAPLTTFAKEEAQAANNRERMALEEVFALPDNTYIVILSTESEPKVYLPIEIGETEAVTIKLKLEEQLAPRPLTLDLLEQILAKEQIEVSEISIDNWNDGLFSGSIRLKQSGESWEMDARPSDALGLAAGTDVPIYASQAVLESAGIDLDDIEAAEEETELEQSL